MNTSIESSSFKRVAGTRIPVDTSRTIPVFALGLALSLFLVISYVLCVVGYIFLPSLPIAHSALSIFLPGFALLSLPSFCLGLIESFCWGWYVALVFGPLYNFFVDRKYS